MRHNFKNFDLVTAPIILEETLTQLLAYAECESLLQRLIHGSQEVLGFQKVKQLVLHERGEVAVKDVRSEKSDKLFD